MYPKNAFWNKFRILELVNLNSKAEIQFYFISKLFLYNVLDYMIRIFTREMQIEILILYDYYFW